MPSPEMRRLLERYMAVNGPIRTSETTFSSAVSGYWLAGKGFGEPAGYRRSRIWAADQPFPAVRAISEERTGDLMFFSAATTAAETGHNPVWSGSEAIDKAKSTLRYFGKTAWCAYPFAIQEYPATASVSPQGAWFLTIRRQERVIQMTIDKQTGSLLYFALAPVRPVRKVREPAYSSTSGRF